MDTVIEQATAASLKAALDSGKLSTRDQGGAQILLIKHNRYGSWTPPQQQWADDILRRAASAGVPTGITTTYTMKIGPAFQKVVDLLKVPGSKLVKPTITLVDDAGDRISITLLASNDVRVRRVHPTVARLSWVLAWIKPDGTYRETKEMTVTAADLLERLGNDVTGTAFANARKTGLCCFCNRKLEDERSTRHGYGPVCAGNFKLPWN